jgi:signal transduction histidine kinase
MSGPITAEQDKQLNMVYKSAKHLLELINDILDLSKIEAGKVTLIREKFSMRELIDRVAQTATPLASEKGLSLSVDFAPRKANIYSDKRRVEQILLNLVNNAIKFTAEGSVNIHGQIVDNRLQISVSDTGIGVEPDKMGILFETFRQIELTRSRKHEGTGLGLAICKKLVILLEGEIWAESEFGKGSTFTFSLPVDKGDPVGSS